VDKRVYLPDDERPHQRGSDPWWQESVFFSWWAEEAGVGGVFRLGHEPNKGLANVWLGLVTSEGRRFRFCESELPLTDADRGRTGVSAHLGGDRLCWAGPVDGKLGWTIRHPDCDANVEIEDFYPMTNLWRLRTGTSLADEFAPEHWEASGRVIGSVRLGDREYQVDGLCHRDHSWGLRKWDSLRSHRWVAGTFGPDLSFALVTWHSTDNVLFSGGYIFRDGEIIRADMVDPVAYLLPDGISIRGGRAEWTLENDTKLSIDCDAVDGVLFTHREVTESDTICRVVDQTGRKGFCDFEMTNNLRDGRSPVNIAVGAALEAGLSMRQEHMLRSDMANTSRARSSSPRTSSTPGAE
jgi:hypothetical protein